MAYGRSRTTRPQNMGANRNRSMRNNARRGGANMPFQGGLGLNRGFPQGPGQSPRGPGRAPQQNQARCPVGQKPGRGPGGAITCVPDTGQGVRGPGAGIPGPNGNKPNKAGY